LQDGGEAVTPAVYSAALLSAVPDPDAWAERLGLGRGPLGLLERALSDTFYPAQTPERLLRGLLRPDSYPPLTGRDVLALGGPPGPGVGQALAHLANLRRTGQVRSADEEREALRAYLQETQNRG
ncbi:MAG: CCA tRNA nucleotidyltransferase, partial [Deinococcus sp.]|nr:CCA tRNA nucleotidyltransferase [Deinococcus sp.]